MNQMQEELLNVRAYVESTFTHELIPWEVLATMARIHGQLTSVVMRLDGWSPPLPDPVPQPKAPRNTQTKGRPRKRYPSDEKRKLTGTAVMTKPTKPKRKYTPPAKESVLHADAQNLVECPLCGVPIGVPCRKMTLGKNSKPIVPDTLLAKGNKRGKIVTHEARRNHLREMRRAMKGMLETFPGSVIEPPQPKVDPAVTEAYGVELSDDGETIKVYPPAAPIPAGFV